MTGYAADVVQGWPVADAAPAISSTAVSAEQGAALVASMPLDTSFLPDGGPYADHPHVAKPPVLIPLCRRGDRAGIERQLRSGETVEETDAEGNTPLHVAVEAPRNEMATVQVLLANGARANAVNYIGAAPLHYVCLRRGNYRGVASILLENGAAINLQTVAGKSPLHFACEHQVLELVEVLCLFGADPNLIDAQGSTAVHLVVATPGGRDTVRRQILGHLVARRANCLVANGEGLTPIHLACRSGYVRCIQYLLEQRVDVGVVTAQGQNALHLACLGGHLEVTQLLVHVCRAAIHAVDVDGNTPLHCCAARGNLECAMLLLKADADPNARNGQQKTALELAKASGTDLHSTRNPELLQLLKDTTRSGSCHQS